MTIFRFNAGFQMRRLMAFPVCALILAAGACEGDDGAKGAIAVPSGREITLIEVITDVPGPAGVTARFRFLAPDLVAKDLQAAAIDMEALCNSHAVPWIAGLALAPLQIILSLSATPVAFGEAAPDVVQFFEAYSVQDGTCIREAF